MTCAVFSQDAGNGRNCGCSDYKHSVWRTAAGVAAGSSAGATASGANTAAVVSVGRRCLPSGDDCSDSRTTRHYQPHLDRHHHYHHHHHHHRRHHCHQHRHHDEARQVVMITPGRGRRYYRPGDVVTPLRSCWYACVTLLFVALAVSSSALPTAGDEGGGSGAPDAYTCGTPADRPLVGPKGVITTPAFPGPFPVPIECEWVIQADASDTMIEVYFTQLYVTDGLVITEYQQYPPTFGLLQGREVFNKSHISQYGQSMTTELPYLVIRFRLDRLEGNHIRVHDDLMDVYGFNITYEMRPSNNEREDVCSLYKCSYSGNCLGNADLT